MWLSILGPLLVRQGETVITVPAAKQRIILAALLVCSGQVISFDELADLVWAGNPPSGARAALRNHVARLRKVLGPSVGARISSRDPGYVLRAEDDELDFLNFEALCARASSAARDEEWPRVWETTEAALRLWRGTALADVPSDTLRQQVTPGLERLRLQALEWHADAGLALGRHAELAPALHALVSQHPLRERFHAQLMLACWRCGQQAEALAAYQQARQILVGELGVEPGEELRDLHQRILNADPALRAHPPASAREVPRQLPATVTDFTGRGAELRALTQMLDDAARGAGSVVIAAISGTAGVGKTTLALHWAHQVAARFGDGQLYVNLRGFDPSAAPTPPEAVIRGFLDALGVPQERIPPAPDAQAGLYRSLLADRTMLLLLDNARDEPQVRPLLPASPASLVLVTSRSQLSGLAAADGARLLSLDVLARDEAVQLLTARLGTGRADAEPAAVSEIASLCAYLPLALAIVAARAAARPRFSLAALAAELHDAADRLDALDAGDATASVRTVFSWSYRQLSDESARMFRLLGLHPGPDISIPAAASLAVAPESEVRRMLGELTRAHLIAEHVPGRFAFHDLLRAYAAAQARDTDSVAEREAAAGRIFDHYLHSASRAGLMLSPARELIALTPPAAGTVPEQTADHRQALAWFDAEEKVLRAAVAAAVRSGFDRHAWQLPWAMLPFLDNRGHYQEWAVTQRTALAAATRLGDIAGQAISSRLMAGACTYLHDRDRARAHYADSLRLYRQLGNRLGEANTHQDLGMLAASQDRYADALNHAEQALRLYRAIGRKAAEADMLNNLGWYHGLLGNFEQARAFCREALAICADVGYRRLEGNAWDSLGYAEQHLGNLSEAAACCERALSIGREVGDRRGEAEALTHLGDVRHAAGQLARAREAWQQALAILVDLEHPDVAKVRAKLAETDG